MEEYPGLAEVLDDALVPASQVLHAVTHRAVQLETPGAGNPSRLLGMAPAAARCGSGRLGHGVVHALDAPHGLPIVLVLGGTEQANLIVMAIGGPPWPGEFMRAAA